MENSCLAHQIDAKKILHSKMVLHKPHTGEIYALLEVFSDNLYCFYKIKGLSQTLHSSAAIYSDVSARVRTLCSLILVNTLLCHENPAVQTTP